MDGGPSQDTNFTGVGWDLQLAGQLNCSNQHVIRLVNRGEPSNRLTM